MRKRMPAFIPLFMGFLVLNQASSHPAIKALRGAEILMLQLSGACFAVGFVLLFGLIRTRKGQRD